MKLVNDFNEPVGYRGEHEYNEVICFGFDKKTGEFRLCVDLSVSAYSVDFDTDGLSAEEYSAIMQFGNEVQQEIREQLQYERNIERL